MKNHVQCCLALIIMSLCAACAGGPDHSVDNPFLIDSPLPLNYPRFDQIEDADFGPAFDHGMNLQLEEIAAIVANPEPPTFDNTFVAMERSGQLLGRARSVFNNLRSADSNEAIRAIEVEYSPRLSAHQDAIWLDAGLYARVKSVYDSRAALSLDSESLRLVERYHTKFLRSGAALSETAKDRLRAINTELATLKTRFNQNVLAEVNDSAVVVDDLTQLDGLPRAQIEAAAEAARARGLEGKWVIALLNTTGQPANTHLHDRELRRRIHEASIRRGSRGNAWDNREIVSRMAALRAEHAVLLGYPNRAAYVLADNTAATTEAVNRRLAQLAPLAVANARREAADIQAMIDREGGGFRAEAFDWAYYAEKVRKERYDFDEAEMMPYLDFWRVLEDGVFFAAEKVYGIRFAERHDLPVYHPDVRVYDVFEADGAKLAIFLLDPYARPSKNGGAWMDSYVDQSGLLGRLPIVSNHTNVLKPAKGQPALMTWYDVITLFHEFGHALHGMFSNVRYPYFTGTSVPRDYVEFPSQVNEMWAIWPEVLENYARHHETGEPMPRELVRKMSAAAKFNQGFKLTESLAAAMLDQRLNQLPMTEVPGAADIMTFQAEMLAADGIDFALVPPRYSLPYFSHIIDGYDAGYYSYIWSEVMDADSVEWFKEHGGLKRENGDAFRRAILSRGGSVEAMQMFRDFRGRDPDIEPLLIRRGLTTE